MTKPSTLGCVLSVKLGWKVNGWCYPVLKMIKPNISPQRG